MNGLFGKINSLSPLSILQRGYSITRKLPDLRILRIASEVRPGDHVEVRLHQGAMLCEVETVIPQDSSPSSIQTGDPGRDTLPQAGIDVRAIY